ncbi:hypothetical protein HAPAU_29440 [Halalkalicoccus paucihalophilus]|uniref:Uncharacterized protein n=1 Tax=Halalkalicoccus paucihalophilus TaxID=1008153 RepID=A0A151ABV4_9EURY|nr:hypothetical protein HAPAU_29440 [Halalkalicoccus paucihalophilus]
MSPIICAVSGKRVLSSDDQVQSPAFGEIDESLEVDLCSECASEETLMTEKQISSVEFGKLAHRPSADDHWPVRSQHVKSDASKRSVEVVDRNIDVTDRGDFCSRSQRRIRLETNAGMISIVCSIGQLRVGMRKTIINPTAGNELVEDLNVVSETAY